MRWLAVVLLGVLSLSGCARRAPYSPDPFFGQTVVPPPGTGMGNIDPAYARPLTSGTSSPANQQPGLNNLSTPPAGPATTSPAAPPCNPTSAHSPNTNPASPSASQVASLSANNGPANNGLMADRAVASGAMVGNSAARPVANTSLFGVTERSTGSPGDFFGSPTRLAPPDYPSGATSAPSASSSASSGTSSPSTSSSSSSAVSMAAVGNRKWSDPVTIGAGAPATRPDAVSSTAASAGSPGASPSVSPGLMPDQPDSAPLRPTRAPPRRVNIMDLPEAPPDR